MKLKFKIAKLEEVDEQFRSLYTEGQDGAFYLSVDGAVDKTKLDEFRNTNIDLMKKLEKYGDVDPSKLQEMLENERKIQEKKLIDAGDIEGLVSQRVNTMKKEYDTKVNKLTEQLTTSNRQLETLLIDNAVREQAAKVGVVASAVDDVLLRAKTVFSVQDGKPVAKDSDGKVIYGKDGTSTLAIGEWMGGLKEQAPHLFGQSSGSGANNRPGGAPNGQNLTAAQKIAAGMQSGRSEAIQ